MILFDLLNSEPLYAIGFIGALVVSITIHEFAHAWAATKLGDPTPEYEGRLTLNPLAHMDPLGTIFLLLVGFGWGKPVPINPNYFRSKNDQLKVAFAGIIANLVFAAILAIPLRLNLLEGHAINTSPVLVILDMVIQLNILLASFNILPIPPLDGSYLVEYFLDEAAKLQYQYVGPYILIGVLLLDRLFGTSIILAVMNPIMNFLSYIIESKEFIQLFLR